MAHNLLQSEGMSANILIPMRSPLLSGSDIIGFNNTTMFFRVKLPRGMFLVEAWTLRETELKPIQGWTLLDTITPDSYCDGPYYLFLIGPADWP